MSKSMMSAAGGAGLYKVIAAANFPDTAPEGTILVMTETPVPAFSMRTSVSQIEAPRTGEVCFVCGSGGSLVYLDKKQRYATAIFAAYQYDGEAWVSVPWYVRESGQWVSPQLVLYSPGNVHTENTGGWSSFQEPGVFSLKSGYMQAAIYGWNSGSPWYCSASPGRKIDVTRFSKLWVKCSHIGGTAPATNSILVAGVDTSKKAAYTAKYKADAGSIAAPTTFFVDITEATGEMYILLSFGGGKNNQSNTIAVYDVWLA